MLTAVVTGASRGIGAALVKLLPRHLDLNIILISTSELSPGILSNYRSMFPSSTFTSIACDLSDTHQLSSLCLDLPLINESVDLLINNAAVSLEKDSTDNFLSLTSVSSDLVLQTLKVNVLAPYSLIKAVLPRMLERNFGRILNVSSGMARAGEYDEFAPAYRMSKRALNGLTLSVHHLVKGKDIFCKSVCPGWVRTDMGGETAIRSPEESAIPILGSLLDPDPVGSGKFFRDMKEIDLEATTKLDHFDLGLPDAIALQVSELVDSFKAKYSGLL